MKRVAGLFWLTFIAVALFLIFVALQLHYEGEDIKKLEQNIDNITKTLESIEQEIHGEQLRTETTPSR